MIKAILILMFVYWTLSIKYTSKSGKDYYKDSFKLIFKDEAPDRIKQL